MSSSSCSLAWASVGAASVASVFGSFSLPLVEAGKGFFLPVDMAGLLETADSFDILVRYGERYEDILLIFLAEDGPAAAGVSVVDGDGPLAEEDVDWVGGNSARGFGKGRPPASDFLFLDGVS